MQIYSYLHTDSTKTWADRTFYLDGQLQIITPERVWTYDEQKKRWFVRLAIGGVRETKNGPSLKSTLISMNLKSLKVLCLLKTDSIAIKESCTYN